MEEDKREQDKHMDKHQHQQSDDNDDGAVTRMAAQEEEGESQSAAALKRLGDRSSTHLPELALGPVFREKAFEKHLSIICLDEYEYKEEIPTDTEVGLVESSKSSPDIDKSMSSNVIMK